MVTDRRDVQFVMAVAQERGITGEQAMNELLAEGVVEFTFMRDPTRKANNENFVFRKVDKQPAPE